MRNCKYKLLPSTAKYINENFAAIVGVVNNHEVMIGLEDTDEDREMKKRFIWLKFHQWILTHLNTVVNPIIQNVEGDEPKFNKFSQAWQTHNWLSSVFGTSFFITLLAKASVIQPTRAEIELGDTGATPPTIIKSGLDAFRISHLHYFETCLFPIALEQIQAERNDVQSAITRSSLKTFINVE